MTGPRRLCVAVAAVVLTSAALEVEAEAASPPRSLTVREAIEHYRGVTWRWQRLMGRPRTPAARWKRSGRLISRRGIAAYWRRQALKARRQGRHPPRLQAWLCIQRYEGAWHANTGNGYFGGLQMDLTFQRRYGSDLLRRKGLAHTWTPYEQMWVAERAYRSGRGFYPWPNTARACGLI